MADKDYSIKVKIDAADSANTLKGIKSAIKDLESTALQIGAGGKGFDQLTSKASELREKLDDVKDSASSLRGTGIEKLTTSFNLLKDSFSGGDIDKAKVAFKGLGSAMNAIPIFLIIEGITKILETLGVFGKITEFVTDLVYKFTDALGLTSHAAEELSKKTIEGLQKQQKALEDRYDSEIQLAQAAGKETGQLEQHKAEEVEKNLRKQYNSLIELQVEKGKLNKDEQKQYEDLQSQLLKASTDRQAKELQNEREFRSKLSDFNKVETDAIENLKIAKLSDTQKQIYLIQKKADEDIKNLDKNKITDYQSTGSQIVAQEEKFKQARVAIEETAAIEIAKIRKEAAEKANKDKVSDGVKFKAIITEDNDAQHQLELDALSKIRGSNISANEQAILDKQAADAVLLNESAKAYSEQDKLYKDAIAAQEKRRQDSFKKSISDFNTYVQSIGQIANQVVGVFSALNDLRQQQAQQELDNFTKASEAKITAINQEKDTQTQIVDNQAALLLSNENLTSEERNRIQTSYNAKKEAIEKKAAQQAYELQLANYNKETAIKKKAFEQDKKLKIASAIIATITGSVAALVSGIASSIPYPGNIVAGVASAAAVAATGAINIAKIQQSQFDAGTPPAPPSLSSGGSGGSGSSFSGSGGNDREGFRAPQFFGLGQTTAANSDGSNVQKVYVTESDITSKQKKVSVIEGASKIS